MSQHRRQDLREGGMEEKELGGAGVGEEGEAGGGAGGGEREREIDLHLFLEEKVELEF